MKKIVLVCNTSWGMMMFRKNLMKSVIENGYKLYVLAPYDDHSKQIKELGAVYINLPIDNKGSNLFKDILLFIRLYKIYKKISPDLIFHYTIKPNVYGTLASFFLDLKSIAVITGLGYTFINDSLTSKIAKLLYKISLKYSQKVWFINHEDQKRFIKDSIVPKNLMEFLPSEGVDMDRFRPMAKKSGDDKFRFTLIARLLWDKGVGELVKAASVIREIYPHVEVDLVGFVDAKNPKAISKEQVDYWENKGWIKYLGSKSDVREYIAESDCIVLPSYREGISKILLEAASMAKPIIASNVPGCRDIVEHGVSGYLFKVKDPYDLAKAMKKIMELNKEERLKMGLIGREHVKREFDEKLVIKKYLDAISFYTVNDRGSNFKLLNS